MARQLSHQPARPVVHNLDRMVATAHQGKIYCNPKGTNREAENVWTEHLANTHCVEATRLPSGLTAVAIVDRGWDPKSHLSLTQCFRA